MKKLLSLIIVTFFISATIKANETNKYGNDITLTEKTLISEIVAAPENYVGKKVLVEGTVVDVCAKRGCWMNLGSDAEYESIRVKVNDGEIVFPMEAKGKKALVEGEVYSLVVEGEACGGDCSDEQKDGKGEMSKCEKEKTTKKIYMIKGLGAVIQ
jgi:uncharacterized protein DUF4920